MDYRSWRCCWFYYSDTSSQVISIYIETLKYIQRCPKNVNTIQYKLSTDIFKVNRKVSCACIAIFSQKMVLATWIPEPSYKMAEKSKEMEAKRLFFQQRETIYIFWTPLYNNYIHLHISIHYITLVNTTEEKKVSTEIIEVIWNNLSFNEDD
jgi:hypothetical protein